MKLKDTIYLDRTTYDSLVRFLRDQERGAMIKERSIDFQELEMVPMDVTFNG